MKKLIVVLILFIIMISLGIGEIFYTTKFFDKIYDELTEVRISMDAHPDSFDNEDTISKAESLLKTWEDNKNFILMLGNHNIMRSVNEKIVGLSEMVRVNATEDAEVSMSILLSLVSELKKDNYPTLTNIF